MKLKYILLSLGVLSMSSCNHLLDVDPHEFSSGDSYYQNDKCSEQSTEFTVGFRFCTPVISTH
ncbi:MAG: hypothetical protein ACTJFN_01135 [Sphingobacterium sp.]